jgi:Flp pilus assembly pilin Flp
MTMTQLLRRLWFDDTAQDVAEYAVMLAVVLTVTLLTIRLIGQNSSNTFSQIGSKMSS